MKLNTQNCQKIQVKRASLWANIYHTASLENTNRGNTLFHPTDMADKALAEFDKRFPVENTKENKS